MERIDLTEPARQAMTLLVYGAPGTGKADDKRWQEGRPVGPDGLLVEFDISWP